MLQATRRWVNRNRTPVAIGLGVLGAGYVATQYVVGKINDARERMSSERVAKENLRRRFEQNQEDCTFTVLALLPTATQNILDAMNTENITYQIQRVKGVKRAGSVATLSTCGPPSLADTTLTEDDGRSVNSESVVHASQIIQSPLANSSIPPTVTEEVPTEQSSDAKPQPGIEVKGQAEGKESVKAYDSEKTSDGGPQLVPSTPTPIPTINIPTDAQDPQATAAAAAAAAARLEAKTKAQAEKVARKTKRQLWADLTISSITRAFTLVYTLALLTMLTRIQLNLLGRRSYLSSVVALATPTFNSGINLENNDDIDSSAIYSDDFDTNRKYLTFSWWLLNRGWVMVRERVESAVRDVFGPLSPRDMLSFDQFIERVLSVRKLVEGSTPDERQKTDWLSILLPKRDQEEEVIRESGVISAGSVPAGSTPTSTDTVAFPKAPASLRKLLDETADIIESPSFTHVLTLLLDSGFTMLVDKKVAINVYDLPSADQVQPSSLEMRDLRASRVVLLPKILSILSREARVIGNGMPNEYLSEMERVSELEAFAAVVYSSNWQTEIEDQAVDDLAPSVAFGAQQNGVRAGTLRSPMPGKSGVVRDEEDESVVMTDAEKSMVIVDPGFENVWEKVTSGGN